MPDVFGFNSPRHVRRALKVAREVLDRKKVEPAGMRMLMPPESSTTTDPGSSTICPCGTVYARGSIEVTLGAVTFDAANEYTFTVTIYGVPITFTLAHTTGAVWESDVEEISTCYEGSHSVLATMTFTGLGSVAGYDIIEASLNIVTDGTNDCSAAADTDEVSEDVDLKWACRIAHPLGTSAFESVDPQDPTNAVNDCVVCVSPVAVPVCDTSAMTLVMTLTGMTPTIFSCGTPPTDAVLAWDGTDWVSELWACGGGFNSYAVYCDDNTLVLDIYVYDSGGAPIGAAGDGPSVGLDAAGNSSEGRRGKIFSSGAVGNIVHDGAELIW